MKKSNKSAAERALMMSGVDVREQRDKAPPKVDYGPKIEERRFGHYTHYSLFTERRTLCGELAPKKDETRCAAKCAERHAEASRMRAVLV